MEPILPVFVVISIFWVAHDLIRQGMRPMEVAENVLVTLAPNEHEGLTVAELGREGKEREEFISCEKHEVLE